MTLATPVGMNEIEIVQNPAIGAFLMWHFALGYQESGSEAVPLPLAFLLLPMLLHRRTFDAVASTRKASGLTLFAAKFDKDRETLIELHGRAVQLRPLSLQSIGVAATARLIRMDYAGATIHGFEPDLLDAKKPRLPERLKGFAPASNKVGYWFSKLGLPQIASTLRIEF